MLRVLKHHIDGLILQYNLLEGDNVLVAYLLVELYYVVFKAESETKRNTLTAISRIALWLMPV
jgi:hypothetical protein